MSNKNKWSKSLRLKRVVKTDTVFKSHWIYKFLSKITKTSHRSKTENFLKK